MDTVIFIVRFDPALATPEFLADHLAELEGVETIEIKDGD